jgi:hypothetical protein
MDKMLFFKFLKHILSEYIPNIVIIDKAIDPFIMEHGLRELFISIKSKTSSFLFLKTEANNIQMQTSSIAYCMKTKYTPPPGLQGLSKVIQSRLSPYRLLKDVMVALVETP